MLNRLLGILFGVGVIALAILIAMGLIHLFIFIAALILAVWLLRRIPFIREKMDELIMKKAAQQQKDFEAEFSKRSRKSRQPHETIEIEAVVSDDDSDRSEKNR